MASLTGLKICLIPSIRFFWMISDLTPRKGHFSFSPWQRVGKTVPQRMRSERAPEHAADIRKSGFIMVRPLEGGNTPVIIESWYDQVFLCDQTNRAGLIARNVSSSLTWLRSKCTREATGVQMVDLPRARRCP
jgi:hypothetical protein